MVTLQQKIGSARFFFHEWTTLVLGLSNQSDEQKGLSQDYMAFLILLKIKFSQISYLVNILLIDVTPTFGNISR